MCVSVLYECQFEMSLREPVLSNYYVSKRLLEPVRSFSFLKNKDCATSPPSFPDFLYSGSSAFPAVVSQYTSPHHEAAFNFSNKATGQHIPVLTDCIKTTTPHAHHPSASLGQNDTPHLL